MLKAMLCECSMCYSLRMYGYHCHLGLTSAVLHLGPCDASDQGHVGFDVGHNHTRLAQIPPVDASVQSG